MPKQGFDPNLSNIKAGAPTPLEAAPQPTEIGGKGDCRRSGIEGWDVT